MPKRTPDLEIGSQWNDWIVLQEIPKPKEKCYLCRCKCGKEKTVSKSNLRLNRSKSCGACGNRLGGKRANSGRKPSHGESDTPLHKVWQLMRSRCKYPTGNNRAYEGITVCKEWEDYVAFRDWAYKNGYKENAKLSIDRINNADGYHPTNCRWVDATVQSQNRRKWRNKSKNLPKGVYKAKPRNGSVIYQGTGKSPYYWIVIYQGKRHQRWGFQTPEEAYEDRCKFIDENYDGLVIYQ